MKEASNMDRVLKVLKKIHFDLNFNFKHYTNLLISVPQFFSNSILIQKFISHPWLREKRERLLDFGDREKKVVDTNLDH